MPGSAFRNILGPFFRDPVKARRAVFWCGVAATAVAVLIAVGIGAALRDPGRVAPLLQRLIAPRGGSASAKRIGLSLDPPSVTLSGLAVSGPSGGGERVRVDRLRLEADFARIARGGPWLRRVEAEGVVVEWTGGARTSTGPLDLTPLSRLFLMETLLVKDARVRVALAGGELDADGAELQIVPIEDGARRVTGIGRLTFRRGGRLAASGTVTVQGRMRPGPTLDADVALRDGRVEMPSVSGDFSGQAGLTLTPDRLEARDARLEADTVRLRSPPGAPREAGPIRLHAAGAVSLDGTDVAVEIRALDVAGVLQASGRLARSSTATLAGNVEGTVHGVERALAFAGDRLPGAWRGAKLRGDLGFRLGFGGDKGRTLSLSVVPMQLLVSFPATGVEGRIGGAVRADGPSSAWASGAPTLSGTIEGNARLDRAPLTMRRAVFRASLAGAPAALAVRSWTVSVAGSDVEFAGRPLPLGALEMRGSASVNGRTVRVDLAEARSEALGQVQGRLSLVDGTADAELTGSGLRASAAVALAEALTGRDMAGWSSSGAIDVSAGLHPRPGGRLGEVAVVFRGIGFRSPSGDLIGQDLSGRLEAGSGVGVTARAQGRLSITEGGLLWSTIYADFARNPLTLRLELARKAPGAYQDIVLEGAWSGFATVRLEGNARRAGAAGWRHGGVLRLGDAQLGPVFQTFVRDPLAASFPTLAALRMAGTGRLDLSFAGTDRTVDIKGAVGAHLDEVGREGGNLLLSGLDLELPFSYALGAADPGRPRPASTKSWGRLRLASLPAAGRALGPVDLPVIVVPNRLYIGDGLDVPFLGAAVSLRDIEVIEPASPAFRVRLSARLAGLDLSRLPAERLPLEGHLDGLLRPVRIGRDRLEAGGVVAGDLFGGRLEIRRLTVLHPFGAGREIGFDAGVRGLDLERFSTAWNIGRVTGIVDASLEGARFAYGQPVAFHLKMESVPSEGVPQTVSLKAVNAISVLSTGSALGGIGLSVMTTFFREFPYRKIGVECDLNNDVFTVRGLIHEGGVEYLVRRGFLAGIDVINRNPDNRIGFADMLERARRVTEERPRE
jgi:hypothetical protein